MALLRYTLGGDRPSQTARWTRSRPGVRAGEDGHTHRLVFHRWLPGGWRRRIDASQLSYTVPTSAQCQPAVKVHGVFPSDRGYVASSPRLQFHRVSRGDSAPVVTPFM